VLTRAETVMVCFDYHKNVSKPVPDEWRAKITSFEGWK
jgi:acyl-CoA thioesterase FadM